MRKHQIENIAWREMVWQRPFSLDSVWDALTHLSALTPRGAVIWECRGSGGQAAYLLGASRIHIGKIEQVFRAHGDIQFHNVPHPHTGQSLPPNQNQPSGTVPQYGNCRSRGSRRAGGDDGGQAWSRDRAPNRAG